MKLLSNFVFFLFLNRISNARDMERNPSSWIHPIRMWSQLNFPTHPVQLLEGRDTGGSVPEPFDPNKINASIGSEGFVVGNKFCQCGRSPWRIQGYEDEQFQNTIPWTATLVLNKRHNVFCGGTLLNDRTVVTAGHCLMNMKPSDVVVHIGDDDFLPSSSTIYETHQFHVRKIQIHPNYNKKTIEHDIALLHLINPIDFMEILVSPACLPVRAETYANRKGTLTEWVSVQYSGTSANNTSDNLMKVTSDLISLEQCREYEDYDGLVSNNHICTKSCRGDHGGQLVVAKKDRMMLAGIGSWGLNCRRRQTPSVFTRVPKYAAWILRNTQQAEWCRE